MILVNIYVKKNFHFKIVNELTVQQQQHHQQHQQHQQLSIQRFLNFDPKICCFNKTTYEFLAEINTNTNGKIKFLVYCQAYLPNMVQGVVIN